MENNMENFEVENQNNEGVEIMEDVMSNEVVANETGLGFLAGLGIGGAAGLGLATGAWFYQRKVRKDVLKALRYSLDVHAAKQAGNITTVKKGRKDIDISSIDVRGKIKFMAFIQENLLKVKMSNSEREEWYKVSKQLMGASVKANQEDIEDQVIVEETIDNKNAQ